MGKNEYILKKIYAVCLFILVVAGLNWGLYAVFKKDAVSAILGKDTVPTRIFFILVACCAIFVGFNRDSYLPFLGQAIVPCSILVERIPDKADLKVRIIAPAGRKVLYWAAASADSQEKLKDWRVAYGDYDNAGVAIAGEDGSALLQVRRPQPYWIIPGNKLEPHVHYRICGDEGMVGPVRSLFIEERVEGFGTAIYV